MSVLALLKALFLLYPVPFMPLDQPDDITDSLQRLPSLLGVHWLRPIMCVQSQLIER